MAEKTTIMLLIRRHLNALLAAGVAAITATAVVATTSVTAPLVNGVNTGGTGDCQTDYCAAVVDEVQMKAPVAAEVYVPTGGKFRAKTTGAEITAAEATDDVTLTASDDFTSTAADVLLTGSATAAIGVTIGGFFNANLTGASITAPNAGDTISLSAADDVTATGVELLFSGSVSSTLTCSIDGGTLAANAGGVTISANGTGDDITLATLDDLTGTAADVSWTGTTSVVTTVATTDFTLDATGFTLDSDGAGDDITITSADLVTMATDAGGSVQTTTGGVSILAISTADDITIQAADTVTLTDSIGAITLAEIRALKNAEIGFVSPIPFFTANATTTVSVIHASGATLTVGGSTVYRALTAASSAGGTITGTLTCLNGATVLSNTISLEATSGTFTGNGATCDSTIMLSIVSDNADAVLGVNMVVRGTYTRTW